MNAATSVRIAAISEGFVTVPVKPITTLKGFSLDVPDYVVDLMIFNFFFKAVQLFHTPATLFLYSLSASDNLSFAVVSPGTLCEG